MAVTDTFNPGDSVRVLKEGNHPFRLYTTLDVEEHYDPVNCCDQTVRCKGLSGHPAEFRTYNVPVDCIERNIP